MIFSGFFAYFLQRIPRRDTLQHTRLAAPPFVLKSRGGLELRRNLILHFVFAFIARSYKLVKCRFGILTMTFSSLLPRIAACFLVLGLSENLRAQNLSAEKVAQFKAATVFIDVAFLDLHASGSGFVVKNDGDDTYIVTNNHVVNVIEYIFEMRGSDTSKAMKSDIRVVFQSGTLKERAATAAIVAADPDRDLAVLKVSKVKDPPTPIDLKDSLKLVELMPLTICGYPLGKATAVENQNPSCTINALTISNIRMNLKTGRIQDIQVSGAMTHGNSGGPIVSSSDGKLVGVAVSGFNGTQIGYAIPRDEVAAVLAGTFGRIRIVPDNYDAEEGSAKLQIAVIDPMKTVKGVTAYYRKSLPETKAKGVAPTVMADAKKLVLKIENGKAVGEIVAPTKGKLAVQVELELASGKVLSPPVEISIVALAVADPPMHPSTKEPSKIAPDLRRASPQDKTNPLPQDPFKARQTRNASIEWYRAQILEPYLANAKSEGKCGEKSKEAIEGCAIYASFSQMFSRRLTYREFCTSRLETAFKAGCRNPILKFFHMMYCKNTETAAARAEEFQKIAKALEKIKAPYLTARVELKRANLLLSGEKASKENARKAYAQAIVKLAKLAKDHSPIAEEALLDLAASVQKEYASAGWGREAAYKELESAFASAGASKLLLGTLKGDYLVSVAGSNRGKDDDEDDGGKDTTAYSHPRLKEAQEAYETVWEADQSRAAAATGMITVCNGLNLDRKEMEKWFQRAMTADPNHYKACEAKLRYLRSHGSQDDRLAFGRQCLRTENYFAGLPFVLVSPQRPSRSKLPEYISTNEIAWADVREYYERALRIWPMDRELLSEFAVYCAAVGEWSAAKNHLAPLKNKPALKSMFPTRKDYDDFVKTVDEHLKNSTEK